MTDSMDDKPNNPKDGLYSKMLQEFFSIKDEEGKKKYKHELRAKLEAEFGGCCQICDSDYKLEFAHAKDTLVGGTGRGTILRLADIISNKDRYRLLCKRCHAISEILVMNGLEFSDSIGKTSVIVLANPEIKVSDIMKFNGDKFVLKKEFLNICKCN